MSLVLESSLFKDVRKNVFFKFSLTENRPHTYPIQRFSTLSVYNFFTRIPLSNFAE